jgi:hypothetical protein
MSYRNSAHMPHNLQTCQDFVASSRCKEPPAQPGWRLDEPYRIRTCDPLLKRQLLCQTELTAHLGSHSTICLPIWQAA